MMSSYASATTGQGADSAVCSAASFSAFISASTPSIALAEMPTGGQLGPRHNYWVLKQRRLHFFRMDAAHEPIEVKQAVCCHSGSTKGYVKVEFDA